MIKVYLAGPEVFLPDSLAIGKKKKELCKKYGFEGLYPLDNLLDLSQMSKEEAGLEISRANEALILSAAAVIANITPFRGSSADVGTVYEIGMAKGLGKVVLAYTHDERPFLTRNLATLQNTKLENGEYRDNTDMAIEDFNLVDNLMIDGGVTYPIIIGNEQNKADLYRSLTQFEQCLQQLHQHFYATANAV
ncbi:nucleoside 2-deoxyribosyltransferase [Vibrio sp. CAU 1672]|uniref:nucleoside 2-deoxyribosyltransferase n=1 Tax=Vibrio sp. CAU 1672 TaxID=3032594 RepID=UPI0023DAD877|nr:nucleoside 2-deoxyribosyltransferase [Vibrio sp. CAU 1672]MDF2152827.1 nucleoside 2-deoxyribosyltransferase [Vibrio sp. CAU 1672]